MVGIDGLLSTLSARNRQEAQARQDELHARLAQEANVDALTGCLNRRRFDEVLADELDRAARHDRQVSLMVLDIDEERRRISLGVKQCKTNPWKEFAENYNRGDKVSGQIKSITDFGIFIGLAGGIDGLVHLSDISWDMPGEEAVRSYQKAQQVDAMVLSIDPERERISLGVKQLAKDPFSAYIAEHPKGSIVTGIVREVDAKGAVSDLGNGVDGQLRASELSRDRVEDARLLLKVGEEVEAKFTGVDRKGRSISLSIKAKDIHEEQEAMQNYRTDSPTGTSLGDLLKEQISGQD